MKMLNINLLCMVIFLVICSTKVWGVDKRVIVHTTPYQQLWTKSTWVYTSLETNQFNLHNKWIGKVQNSISAIKNQIHYSPFQSLELGFESLYIINRKQIKTNASGSKTTSIDSSGLGDSAIQLTYVAADSRKQDFGFILGTELSLPSGDEDSTLGTGTYDLSLRSTVSVRTSVGFPYLATIYTWTGDKQKDGKRIEKPDDLMVALGFKSRPWHRLSFDARLFRYFLHGDSVNYYENIEIVNTAHDIPGWRMTIKYLFSEEIEANIFFERAWPEDHLQSSNRMVIKKSPETKDRFAITFRIHW